MTFAYHSIDNDSLHHCLTAGLAYGERGARSNEGAVQRANDYLDEHTSSELRAKGLSREQCLYMYPGLGDFVLDIQTGLFAHWQEWDAGEGFRKLRVRLDPTKSYMSDLVAYDQLKSALEQNKSDELPELAQRYWSRIVPWSDFLQSYHIANSRLEFVGDKAAVPPDYSRVEVMVTGDIPPSAIQAL